MIGVISDLPFSLDTTFKYADETDQTVCIRRIHESAFNLNISANLRQKKYDIFGGNQEFINFIFGKPKISFMRTVRCPVQKYSILLSRLVLS